MASTTSNNPLPNQPHPAPITDPFLKWAGGKRQLLPRYWPYLPPLSTIQRYFEPFMGSAALFFAWQPPRTTLSDANWQLVDLYDAVKNELEGVIDALAVHRNDADYFYQVRAQDPAQLTAVERAARLIFLNKTCYNGLYRENRKGQFNVPFGRYKNPTICDPKRLRAASAALQSVQLQTADFSQLLAQAGPGDFVYLDPPYVPLSATSQFTSYSRHGFDAADQRRLATAVADLTARGCKVMLSNSAAPLVYQLYDGRGYQLIPIPARRQINSNGRGRGPITELLILNYSPTD